MDWVTMIGQLGFPILVSLYLLHRMEKKLDQLSQSIHELAMSLK
ncbi:YvrJ family protein [Cytobacillus depressus]|uniref:YvrJ family protein n=1 Tax=Cytobacillus depressus TaxID=1602942 RepID=A0A6L3UZ67_9BACI|nr:YvrJ family protein [Cytobacillus depressus]KAB2328011.1 YvrJ family protein [Cytobacillus depressus]